ncbi:MAG: hypothetical protein FKY71_09955 [Spiribacter salinus]|uniref:Uncharacterized protein n=1 Tax=Spiribacter salinus TaxID=1335746 RepID=A0A540VR03_9GAMM|nr:MAG: hypothetical protein FKY71_09955 [Spiribacter salinus]
MKPRLPNRPIPFQHGRGVFEFSNKHRYWCRVLGFRPPNKGDYYLSGADVAAYRAPNDLTTPYWIVEKIEPQPTQPNLHEDAR